METSVKWNLEEATEISVLSGWDIIRFKKNTKTWTYGMTGKPDVRSVTHDKLHALLEKYEAAGCGVLIASPKKEEPLKLGTKMVEVSTKEFDWKDVQTVNIYKYGRKAVVFKFEGDQNGDYVKHREVFAKVNIDADGVRTKSHHMWDELEIREYMRESSTEMVEIYNHDGELMSYEQN